MRRVVSFALCFGVALLAISPGYGADSLWVTSDGAKLKSDHSASAKTVSELAVGSKLTVLKSEKRWHQVRTGSGDEGWIYRGKVSDTPPEKETGDTGNLFAGLQGSSISADEAQTSRSIRGLSKETEQYAKQAGTPESCQKALDYALSLKADPKEVDLLLKSGKIGEYAQ